MPRPRKAALPTYGTPHVPPVLDWEVAEAFRWNGRPITAGTELSIRGESGRFRFQRHVHRPNGLEWIDVVGGPKDGEMWRSFRPNRIRTVHRINRMRANTA